MTDVKLTFSPQVRTVIIPAGSQCMEATRLKQVRRLPRPGVPLGYLPGGKPVYPVLGASPDDDSEIETDSDSGDDETDSDDDDTDSEDADSGDKGFQKIPRAEWLKVQNSLSKANATAKQRREALAERDRRIKLLEDEKAEREAADERRQLEQGRRAKGKDEDGEPERPAALPDSVMTKSQVRQAVAEATRETEERTAAKYQTRVANLAAREALVGAGVPRASVARAVRMLNLDEVEVDDDGEVTGGLEDQIEVLKQELPQLFQTAESVRPARKRTPVAKVTAADRQDVEQQPLSTAERMARQVLGDRV